MTCNEVAKLPPELESSVINAPVIVIPPDGENRDVISELQLLLPSSSVWNSIEKVTKRKRKGNNNCQELTETIITAVVNKIMKTDESTPLVEESINKSFLRFHCIQIKELLANKTVIQQTRIRNRLNAFIDELYDEYET